MKILKYCSAVFLLFMCTSLSLQAQDTILNRSVSVQREYRPVIQDAGKINSMPQVLEPNENKSPAVYSNFNLPLNAGYNIHTLPAADLVTEKPEDPNKGFARIGFGNYLNTLADFAYPLVNTPDMKLDFSLNHLATFEAKRMHTTTRTNLSFDKLFKTFDLYAGVGGAHEYLRYYGNSVNAAIRSVGLDTLAASYPAAVYLERNRQGIDVTPRQYPLKQLAGDSIGNTFWRFHALAGVHSLSLSEDWRYQAEMQYRLFSSRNGMAENLVHTQAGLNSQNGKNRMGLDFAMDNMMYSSTAIPDFNYWKSYTVLSLNPYYSIERESYNVRLGLKLNLSFVHGKLISPVADVRGEWKLVPKILSLYGGLSGDYEVNTLDKINTENPYMFSDLRVLDTYTPVDFYVGLKLKPLYNLLVDGYIDYKQIDNQYFFVNKGYLLDNPQIFMPGVNSYLYTNRFNVTYGTASHVKMGIRANYNLKKMVNVELKWAYNSWSVKNQQYAWNKPKYEAQLNTDIRINPNLWVSANMYYEGVRYAELGSLAVPMNDKVDINLGVNYSYTNWLTVFGRINNVINNHYQDFYGYDVQGTNLMIGAALSF